MISRLSEIQLKSLSGEAISDQDALFILNLPDDFILPLCYKAYEIRAKHWGNVVKIHVINNAKNGFCPEDCKYCVQSLSSDSKIADYPMKSDEEIMNEAKQAHESGAFRYCMVFSGRGPSDQRVKRLSGLIKKIKSQYPIEICLSAGLMDGVATSQLKDAGLDRLNHNLNTSSSYYEKICSSHTYDDRLNTLKAGQNAGLSLCSGFIAGMGETQEDLLEVVFKLRDLEVKSIPVNFYLPIKGAPLMDEIDVSKQLTPFYCLKILSLFRFVNPTAEIRIAAGREYHLRQCQVLGLYPANSIFMDGYLNTKGSKQAQTLQMIKDAGFTIDSEYPLEALINQNHNSLTEDDSTSIQLKELVDLKK